jgi:hypothetical protein
MCCGLLHPASSLVVLVYTIKKYLLHHVRTGYYSTVRPVNAISPSHMRNLETLTPNPTHTHRYISPEVFITQTPTQPHCLQTWPFFDPPPSKHIQSVHGTFSLHPEKLKNVRNQVPPQSVGGIYAGI